MYFYALGLVKGVSGTMTESAAVEDQYTMAVHAADGSVACTLTNAVPVRSGPSNTVAVTCGAPAGSGVATGAVVNVTGP